MPKTPAPARQRTGSQKPYQYSLGKSASLGSVEGWVPETHPRRLKRAASAAGPVATTQPQIQECRCARYPIEKKPLMWCSTCQKYIKRSEEIKHALSELEKDIFHEIWCCQNYRFEFDMSTLPQLTDEEADQYSKLIDEQVQAYSGSFEPFPTLDQSWPMFKDAMQVNVQTPSPPQPQPQRQQIASQLHPSPVQSHYRLQTAYQPLARHQTQPDLGPGAHVPRASSSSSPSSLGRRDTWTAGTSRYRPSPLRQFHQGLAPVAEVGPAPAHTIVRPNAPNNVGLQDFDFTARFRGQNHAG
ncbi:hypothetical protein EVG20_g1141 [Dentipellis fragilis]|uniref:Uncharacterized protein n=1 Tax=Dentipellis fragilis TaxID=205917 RepID=A0A4Y9ZDC8_9AGAM|nr:hypothetical protein EVG20_g1141 [Dentipellis fragilis]